MLHYFNKDYDRARADLDKSISLQPSANYPYVIAAVIALRQGRINDGRQLIQTILNKFPDPRLGELLLRAAYGDPERSNLSFGAMISGGTNLFLGQYDAALRDADLTIKIDPTITDAHLTRGLAFCALGKYKEAQQAYTDGLAQDPSYALLYLLRAETHLRQNNPAALALDIAAVQNAKLGAEVDALIQEGLEGKLSCTSFLNFRAGAK
jgi:tetratricopeptide (TPR) repeat protein